MLEEMHLIIILEKLGKIFGEKYLPLLQKQQKKI